MRMQKRSIVTPCCGKRFRHIFERGATSIIYDCECGKRYKLNFFMGKYGKTGNLFYKMIIGDKKTMNCSCGEPAEYICECGCLCCGEYQCIFNCGGSVMPLKEGLAKGIKPKEEGSSVKKASQPSSLCPKGLEKEG